MSQATVEFDENDIFVKLDDVKIAKRGKSGHRGLDNGFR